VLMADGRQIDSCSNRGNASSQAACELTGYFWAPASTLAATARLRALQVAVGAQLFWPPLTATAMSVPAHGSGAHGSFALEYVRVRDPPLVVELPKPFIRYPFVPPPPPVQGAAPRIIDWAGLGLVTLSVLGGLGVFTLTWLVLRGVPELPGLRAPHLLGLWLLVAYFGVSGGYCAACGCTLFTAFTAFVAATIVASVLGMSFFRSGAELTVVCPADAIPGSKLRVDRAGNVLKGYYNWSRHKRLRGPTSMDVTVPPGVKPHTTFKVPVSYHHRSSELRHARMSIYVPATPSRLSALRHLGYYADEAEARAVYARHSEGPQASRRVLRPEHGAPEGVSWDAARGQWEVVIQVGEHACGPQWELFLARLAELRQTMKGYLALKWILVRAHWRSCKARRIKVAPDEAPAEFARHEAAEAIASAAADEAEARHLFLQEWREEWEEGRQVEHRAAEKEEWVLQKRQEAAAIGSDDWDESAQASAEEEYSTWLESNAPADGSLRSWDPAAIEAEWETLPFPEEQYAKYKAELEAAAAAAKKRDWLAERKGPWLAERRAEWLDAGLGANDFDAASAEVEWEGLVAAGKYDGEYDAWLAAEVEREAAAAAEAAAATKAKQEAARQKLLGAPEGGQMAHADNEGGAEPESVRSDDDQSVGYDVEEHEVKAEAPTPEPSTSPENQPEEEDQPDEDGEARAGQKLAP
jgi:hypothetical protein